MKEINHLLRTLCLTIFFTATASSAPPLQQEDVIKIARADLAPVAWSSSATYDVRHEGDRGLLSSWYVVVSCTTCAAAGSADGDDVIALSLDYDGNVLCAGTLGTSSCKDDTGRRGGVTSRDINVTNSQGATIKARESWFSGGGRTITVAVYVNHKCVKRHTCDI